MATHTATLLVDSQCTLGEGLAWSANRQAWFWTDIEGAALWMHRPADGLTRQWRTPDRLGTFALCASGAVVLAMAKGLARGLWTGPLEAQETQLHVTPLVAVEPEVAGTRVNDGRTDRQGALVFGTYNEREDGATGHFYQFTERHGLRRLTLAPVTIANSICFSPNGDTMYFCDSPLRRILRCSYDSATASVGPVAPFVTLEAGMPDGSVVDAEGGLWNAEWGTGRVRRYDADGRVTDVVEVAAPHTTCPAFGGATLTELGVTCARMGLSPSQLSGSPTSGGLFHAQVGIRGLTDALFDD